MSGFNPYAAGAKVYNAGSSAANAGMRLDPLGYVEREMNKPRRQPDYTNPQSTTVFGRAFTDKLQQPKDTPTQQPDQGAGTWQAPKSVDLTKSGISANGGAAPTVAFYAPTSVTGQLKFPVDYDLAQEKANQYDMYTRSIDRIKKQSFAANQEYDARRRDLVTAADAALKTLVSDFGARGMVFSSSFGNENTDVRGRALESLGDLDRQRANQFSMLNADAADAYTAFQNALRTIMGTQARRDDEEAGSF